MKFLAVLMCLTVSACAPFSALPTMKYCEKVSYVRDGNKAVINAECSLPVGEAIPGL